MKKVVLLALILFSILFCKSAPVRTEFKGCVIEETPGFIKPHSVRILSTGRPKAGETNMYRKRSQSESAALICAQYYITQKYSDGKNVLTNGIINQKSFDGEDNCILDYQVTHKTIYDSTPTSFIQILTQPVEDRSHSKSNGKSFV